MNPPHRLARALGVILHPGVPGFFVALHAAIEHEGGLTARLVGVAALVSACCLLLPLAALYAAFRLGWTTDDLWARRRENRRYFYPAALLGLGLSFSIFVWVYPFPLASAMVLSALAVTTALSLVNRRVKASIHVAGDAAIALAAIYAYGAEAAPLLALAPIVAWARVQSGAHSRSEVLAGGVIGLLGTAAALALIRP